MAGLSAAVLGIRPSNALEHGADIAKVQRWLGHANLATTQLYDKRQGRPEDSPTRFPRHERFLD